MQLAGKKNCWNLFVACQIFFQLSTVAVQIQPAGKHNCWNLFVACQIFFQLFHSSSTDSTCRQKKLLEPVCCMSNTFSFPQQLYRFNLGAKTTGWNLFVACQIFSIFHSSSTDSTWGHKTTVGTCLLHVKYFQFSTVAVQIQPAGKNNWWNLFVACQIFFHFSTVAVQIQPAGKNNWWNLFVACQIFFSVFHSSSTDSTCRQNKLLEPVCCMSNIFLFFHSSSTLYNLQAKKNCWNLFLTMLSVLQGD